MTTDNDYYKINKKKVKKGFLHFLTVLFILFIVYLLVAPMYCDYTDRAKNSMLGLAVASTRNYLTDHGINNDTVAKMRLEAQEIVQKNDIISYFDINNDGSMVLFSVETGTFFHVKPIIKDKKIIEWKCIGMPKAKVQASCR